MAKFCRWIWVRTGNTWPRHPMTGLCICGKRSSLSPKTSDLCGPMWISTTAPTSSLVPTPKHSLSGKTLDVIFVNCWVMSFILSMCIVMASNWFLLVSLSYDNTVRIFRLGKKDDGSIGNITSSPDNDFKNTIPEGMLLFWTAWFYKIMFWPCIGIIIYWLFTAGKGDIIGIDVASTGKFILTVHSDVHLLLWDLKGRVLATINTNQVQ